MGTEEELARRRKAANAIIDEIVGQCVRKAVLEPAMLKLTRALDVLSDPPPTAGIREIEAALNLFWDEYKGPPSQFLGPGAVWLDELTRLSVPSGTDRLLIGGSLAPYAALFAARTRRQIPITLNSRSPAPRP